MSLGFSHYLSALTNYSAQSLILGNYDVVKSLFVELQNLLKLDSSFKAGNLTPIYNNYAISLVLSKDYDEQDILDALAILLQCKDIEKDDVGIMLLTINIANLLYMIPSKRNDGLKTIIELYNQVYDNTNIDEYYR